MIHKLKQMLSGTVKTTSGSGCTTRQWVDLSTGGFVEIVLVGKYRVETTYVRIHIGQPKHLHALDEGYKYVRYGNIQDSYKLLRELRDAITALDNKGPYETAKKYQRKSRRLPPGPTVSDQPTTEFTM